MITAQLIFLHLSIHLFTSPSMWFGSASACVLLVPPGMVLTTLPSSGYDTDTSTGIKMWKINNIGTIWMPMRETFFFFWGGEVPLFWRLQFFWKRKLPIKRGRIHSRNLSTHWGLISFHVFGWGFFSVVFFNLQQYHAALWCRRMWQTIIAPLRLWARLWMIR